MMLHQYKFVGVLVCVLLEHLIVVRVGLERDNAKLDLGEPR